MYCLTLPCFNRNVIHPWIESRQTRNHSLEDSRPRNSSDEQKTRLLTSCSSQFYEAVSFPMPVWRGAALLDPTGPRAIREISPRKYVHCIETWPTIVGFNEYQLLKRQIYKTAPCSRKQSVSWCHHHHDVGEGICKSIAPNHSHEQR